MSERRIEWRLFCPRCLDVHESLVHVGVPDQVAKLGCDRCLKNYTVQTGVGPDGMPQCSATPVFIRAPEVVTDSHPFVLP